MINMFMTSDERGQLIKSLNRSRYLFESCDHAVTNKAGYVAVMKKLIENTETCSIPRHIMYNINITIPVTDDVHDIIDFYRGVSLAHKTFIWSIEEIAIERMNKNENN